jgi:ABC-type antimicrobial peptide transport system permease subunit
VFGAGENLLVRTRVAPEAIIPELRREWQVIAPLFPISEVQTGDELVNQSLAPQRFAAAILGAFGALAILLAAVGLYGVMACAVARRTREIGIRLAIGAAPHAVVRQVLRRALALCAAGLVPGVAASVTLAPFISSQVKDVSPYDMVTFTAVAVLLTGVSLTAALLPALRAARIDPLEALRCE